MGGLLPRPLSLSRLRRPHSPTPWCAPSPGQGRRPARDPGKVPDEGWDQAGCVQGPPCSPRGFLRAARLSLGLCRNPAALFPASRPAPAARSGHVRGGSRPPACRGVSDFVRAQSPALQTGLAPRSRPRAG